MTSINNAKTSLDFVERLVKFLEKIRNFKPEVKSLRVNYLDKTTEMKLLLSITRGIRRRLRHIEIPTYPGYSVEEIFDGNTFNRIKLDWKKKGSNWVADAKKLTASDNYFVIMKGSISQDSLDELVRLYCPEDPKRGPDVDLYWIDSALKDMAILERIYDELTIDKVSTCVNIGVERQFSSSLPREIKSWLRARAEADIYLASKNRGQAFKSFYQLRIAQRKVGRLSASDIYKLGQKALSPEEFMYYITVEKPFWITGLIPVSAGGYYPEKIGVRVQTDLNYRKPVAQGNLVYKKIEFATKLTDEFHQLPGLPKKLLSGMNKKQR